MASPGPEFCLSSPLTTLAVSQELTDLFRLPAVKVYKLGGSLLDWPELPTRLRELWRQSEPSDSAAETPRPLVIVGGGTAADVVREWDRLHQLGEETAHFLAIESLSLTARLLTTLLPETCLVATPRDLSTCWAAHKIPVLDIPRWTEWLEPLSSLPLPHDWQTTSDSIALWLTRHLPATSFTLLKSTSAPPNGSIFSASQTGLIDPQFPQLLASAQFPAAFELGWLNLRSGEATLPLHA